MIMHLLRLYVAGRTPKTEKAIENMRSILDEYCEDEYSCEVIDLVENPQLGGYDQILVTPTVIKLLPPPVIRVTGDLSDREKTRGALGL